MAPPTKTQAFTRGLPWAAYTAYTIISVLIYLPFYMLKYIVPSFRQNPRWSFVQALGTQVTRLGLQWFSMTEFSTAQITSVKKNLGDFVQLPPGDDAIYEDLLTDKDIQPRPVGAVWVPEAPKSPIQADQFITLHLHGGAYVMLSPAAGVIQDGPRCIAKQLGTPVLMPDYRLSCNPHSRFPAALQDAITAYKSLLDQGYAASRIIVSGDSAGGHLVLTLLRHIAEHPNVLPTPGAAFLWSPWTDMTSTEASMRNSSNYHTDYIVVPLVAWALREFIPQGRAPSEPYFSPRHHPFKTETRLFIHGGTSELSATATKDTAEAFSRIPGNRVELNETPDGMHDLFAGADGMGFGKERDAFIQAAHEFARRP